MNGARNGSVGPRYRTTNWCPSMIKRDYVRVCPRPDAEIVMRQLPAWIAHYNEVHPHKALAYRSPRSRKTLTVSGRSGATSGVGA